MSSKGFPKQRTKQSNVQEIRSNDEKHKEVVIEASKDKIQVQGNKLPEQPISLTQDNLVKEVSTMPVSLPVFCGKKEGVFYPDGPEIETEVNGKRIRITPVEFEKLSGYGSNKKWKCSIRIHLDDNKSVSVATWLRQNGNVLAKRCAYGQLEKSEISQICLEEEESRPNSAHPKESNKEKMEDILKQCVMPVGLSDVKFRELEKLKRHRNTNACVFVDFTKMSQEKLEAFFEKAQEDNTLFQTPKRKTKEEKAIFDSMRFKTSQPVIVNSIGRKRRRDIVSTEPHIQSTSQLQSLEEDELVFEMLESALPLSFQCFQVSLSDLYHQVNECGGYEAVMEWKQWADVAKRLNLVPKGEDSDCEKWLQETYESILWPFYHKIQVQESEERKP